MPLDPTDAEIIRQAIDSRLIDVHTGMPGIVEKYDASKQTCDVKPAIKRVIKNPGQERLVEEIPIVQNVRVQWPSAGGFWVTMPIKKGDYVWLVFSEASDNKFRETGDEAEPDDLRRHNLGDASCYPIPGPDDNTTTDASDTDMVLGKDGGAIITIESGGDILIGRGAVEKIARADRIVSKLSAHEHTYVADGSGSPVQLTTLGPIFTADDVGADKGKVE